MAGRTTDNCNIEDVKRAAMMDAIASYFDLTAGLAERRAMAPIKLERPPVAPQYLAVAAGVAAEPILSRFIAHQPLGLAAILPQVVFGVIVAIIVFPGVYRNAFDPERPIFVQICAIFACGVGWQSLLHAATASATDALAHALT
ncbi:MAG TPA: hypothetical protein VIT38_15365 [Allosphingosinicella sp.]